MRTRQRLTSWSESASIPLHHAAYGAGWVEIVEHAAARVGSGGLWIVDTLADPHSYRGMPRTAPAPSSQWSGLSRRQPQRMRRSSRGAPAEGSREARRGHPGFERAHGRRRHGPRASARRARSDRRAASSRPFPDSTATQTTSCSRCRWRATRQRANLPVPRPRPTSIESWINSPEWAKQPLRSWPRRLGCRVQARGRDVHGRHEVGPGDRARRDRVARHPHRQDARRRPVVPRRSHRDVDARAGILRAGWLRTAEFNVALALIVLARLS